MDSNLRNFPPASPRKKKNLWQKRFKAVLGLAALIVFIALVWSFFNSGSSAFNFVFSTNPLKSTNNRVNVLLLGNAGGTHDGAELTDSIIIASYHLKTRQVTLISIPRDLWLDSVKAKVNAAYEIGEQTRNGGSGLKFAEDKIDDILGIPIHYGIRLNFDGFAKAIDLAGGVDVEVPKTFDDYNYPLTGKENDLCGLLEKEVEFNEEQIKQIDPDGKLKLKPGKNKVLVDTKEKVATEAADFSCRFEHIFFEKGNNHLDGTTALKFVRSRMGTNGEGSDFARSRRQQLVIQGFREKALSLETLTNPKKIADLIGTLGKSIESDIPAERYLDFYNLSKKVDGIKSLVLGDLGQGKSILIAPPPSDYGGAYVLIPPNNDFSKVKEFLKAEMDKQSLPASAGKQATTDSSN